MRRLRTIRHVRRRRSSCSISTKRSRQYRERGETISRTEAAAEVQRDNAAKEYDKSIHSSAAAHGQIVAYQREESALLQGVRQQLQLVDQNPFLSIDEKKDSGAAHPAGDRSDNLKIEEGNAKLAGGALDPATYDQVSAGIQRATDEVGELGLKLQTLSFGGGLRAELTRRVNSFGLPRTPSPASLPARSTLRSRQHHKL